MGAGVVAVALGLVGVVGGSSASLEQAETSQGTATSEARATKRVRMTGLRASRSEVSHPWPKECASTAGGRGTSCDVPSLSRCAAWALLRKELMRSTTFRFAAVCLALSVPSLAVAAATRENRVAIRLTRGAVTQGAFGAVSGGGLKLTLTSGAIGADRFRTSTSVVREVAPLVLETTSFGTNVTCDLPGVSKVSPVEIRFDRRVTSASGATETTFALGAPTFPNVTFTAPRGKSESALGAWARAAATSPGTARKDVTLALKNATGDVRTLVLRGAMPVLYAPLETTLVNMSIVATETLEVKVDRVEIGGATTTFGGDWLGAALRGQDPRGDVIVTYLVAENPTRTTTYAASFPVRYKTGEITVGSSAIEERWEIQPGPGAQPY